jgi:hypothetical protein
MKRTIEWWPLKSCLNGMREETDVGPASAMALEHWHKAALILVPEATLEDVEKALKSFVEDGLMAFDPAVEIETVGGHKITIAGYYRSAP